LQFGWAPLRSVREQGFKFIEAPRPELYNLQLDPAELNNTYEPWSDAVKRLRALLAELHSKDSQLHGSRAAIPTDTLNELKALGYLGPADAGTTTNVPLPSLLPDPKDRIHEQNLLHAAMIDSSEGRTDEAQRNLLRVLDIHPKSPIALRELGELEIAKGKYAQAVRHLRSALEQRPNDASIAFLEGE